MSSVENYDEKKGYEQTDVTVLEAGGVEDDVMVDVSWLFFCSCLSSFR